MTKKQLIDVLKHAPDNKEIQIIIWPEQYPKMPGDSLVFELADASVMSVSGDCFWIHITAGEQIFEE